VKIEEGKSTEVPVCGMVYLVHLTGCAETVDIEAASVKARATIVTFIVSSGSRSLNRRSPVPTFLERRLDLTYRPAFAVRDHADFAPPPTSR
jgi:hypothetical protein